MSTSLLIFYKEIAQNERNHPFISRAVKMHQHITLSLNRIIAGIKKWLASRKLFKNHLINQRKNHAQDYIVMCQK